MHFCEFRLARTELPCILRVQRLFQALHNISHSPENSASKSYEHGAHNLYNAKQYVLGNCSGSKVKKRENI